MQDIEDAEYLLQLDPPIEPLTSMLSGLSTELFKSVLKIFLMGGLHQNYPHFAENRRYICVSFVQKGQDLQELIDIMDAWFALALGLNSRSCLYCCCFFSLTGL